MNDNIILSVISATNLPTQKHKPYLIVKFGNDYIHETKPLKKVKGTAKFNELFKIPMDRRENKISIELWQRNKFGSDMILGTSKITINNKDEGHELKQFLNKIVLTFKFTIDRNSKIDDEGKIESTSIEDFPFIGNILYPQYWEIVLKENIINLYSPTHLFNEKINLDYISIERIMGMTSLQDFIFQLKFESQFEDKNKKILYNLLDPGTDIPFIVRKQYPALNFICSYAIGSLIIQQFTTVIDVGSGHGFIINYYSNCSSKNREVYERLIQQSNFIPTLRLPYLQVDLTDVMSIKVPYAFKMGTTNNIVFLFSPIQQIYKDIICDNFMIQLIKNDLSLVKTASEIQNQFKEEKNLEIIQDLELIDIEMIEMSTIIYAYRFEFSYQEKNHPNRTIHEIFLLTLVL
ncbi:hypothetical protein ABK040_007908 [Willaertia magna]